MSGLKEKMAPTIPELEASTPLPEVHELETKQPTISIVGCGGCGINLIKKFCQINAKFDTEIKMSVIDTSMSNTQQLPSTVKVYGIGNLGSGKDRSKNEDAIEKFLENNKKLVSDATDITIIMFSMAGGSGSVIGPSLGHRLMRNSGRAVILIGVVDISSERDCFNSIATLRTCSKFSVDGKYYFPLMLFSNIDVGRVAVDRSIVRRLIELVDMLSDKGITEVDYTDKMNYLRPTNIGCPSGCYILSVTAKDPSEGEDLPGELGCDLEVGDRVHACFVVNDTGITPKIKTTATYVGISENKKFFSTIGTAIPPKILAELKETAEGYGHSKIESDTTEDSFDGIEEVVGKSGTVL